MVKGVETLVVVTGMMGFSSYIQVTRWGQIVGSLEVGGLGLRDVSLSNATKALLILLSKLLQLIVMHYCAITKRSEYNKMNPCRLIT